MGGGRGCDCGWWPWEAAVAVTMGGGRGWCLWKVAVDGGRRWWLWL